MALVGSRKRHCGYQSGSVCGLGGGATGVSVANSMGLRGGARVAGCGEAGPGLLRVDGVWISLTENS